MLLRPFRPELLTPADAPVLAAVAERYGEGWMSELLAEWDLGGSRGWYRAPQERLSWIAALPELCLALNGPAAAASPRLLLAACWIWLAESVGRARSIIQPSRRAQTLDECRRRSPPARGRRGQRRIRAQRHRGRVSVCRRRTRCALPGEGSAGCLRRRSGAHGSARDSRRWPDTSISGSMQGSAQARPETRTTGPSTPLAGVRASCAPRSMRFSPIPTIGPWIGR